MELTKQEKASSRSRDIVTLERKGHQLILPTDMSIKDAIIWLRRRLKEEEEIVTVFEETDLLFSDGLVAFARALEEMFGWSIAVPKMGMFGPEPPKMIGIEIGFEKTIQVPHGSMQVPGIEGELNTNFYMKGNVPLFQLSASVRNKHKDMVGKLAALVRKFGREQSIYKGKAIRPKFPNQADEPSIQDYFPEFLDLGNVSESTLVFNDQTDRLIETNMFAPVRYTERFRKERIPLKTGILLEGKYGCGKTLTAYVLAKICEQNNWTFMMVRDPNKLTEALELARQFEPSVVFCEDIDRVTAGSERTVGLDSILNTIDGVGSKDSELMTVLTTNHVETINQAMLRPGRLDVVIPITPPNADSVERLVRNYAGSMLSRSEDLTKVGKLLEGQIPATVREVVERSRRWAISRTQGEVQNLAITNTDLENESAGIMQQVELMNRGPEPEISSLEKAASIIAQGLEG
jgi:transitional endoplasmic reticulum ATPase